MRSGYSFRVAVGHLPDVISRIKETGSKYAPICDRNSTFGFVKWTKLAKDAGLIPIYGVELGVVPELGLKKPPVDYWRFFAPTDLKPLHKLIYQATSNPGKEPSLLYRQALDATQQGLVAIAGERCLLDNVHPCDNFYLGLLPSSSKGLVNAGMEKGLPLFASSDNYYPRIDDLEFYRVALGWRGGTQTYPRHILTEEEWHASVAYVASRDQQEAAIHARDEFFAHCTASLQTATLLTPEKPKTLRVMCEEGAQRTGANLADPVYAARLDMELRMIAEKQFEDYFYILEDLMRFARANMICGPARGSSCGSLVCYLLDITTVDPIPYGLLFQRFIDTSRADLPDVDIDLSDQKRHLVFEYAEQKYGKERVARLGTVGMFKPRSALKQAGEALQIPKWKTEKVLDSLIQRSSGDSRALQALEDTLNDTEAGRKLKSEHPEILIAGRMEGHPVNASQHAAGIVITEEPVGNFVAIDARTGATFCDKYDAETLNLLKIDALGLTQLSIFERTMELIGKKPVSGWLETLPLDDQAAFDVLNKGHFSGVFQFIGGALKSLTKQIHVDKLDDLVAITALARPGPMASGGANEWVKRRTGTNPVTYPHPVFEPYLNETLGIIIYQEQVMQIGRQVGGMSWDDVTGLRKAMSKSLGKEFFDKYGEKWKPGAREKGIPEEVLSKVWDDLTAYGAWCLSGDTVLKNPHQNQFAKSEFTIRELYNAGGHAPGAEVQGRRQKLLMWDGQGLKPFKTVDVTYSGRKETFILVTRSGKSIRATKNHRFLSLGGTYRALMDLHVGESIMVIGERQLTKRKEKTNTGSGRHNWRETEKAGGLFFNGKRGQRTKILKRDKKCKCGKPVQEVHHRNMDHKDHRMANLVGVCRKCHKAYHRKAGVIPKPYQKGWSIKEDEIISITSYGIEETYDISMPDPHNNFLANDFVVHNSFNKSHAVAYGLLSYFCLWLKAHHPVEFAAATLDAQDEPEKQIALLRELALEGVDYVPVDANHSIDRWTVAEKAGKKTLVGPLTSVKGIGPATVKEVVACRRARKPIRPTILKRLNNAKTDIDSLTPIRDAVKRAHPDLSAVNILSLPTNIIDVQCGVYGDIVVIGVLNKIAPKDENEAVNIAKRGGRRLSGPTAALNLFIRDDTDEIFAKINRYDMERIGRQVVEKGVAKKTLVAIKGNCPKDFRMLSVKQIKILGSLDD